MYFDATEWFASLMDRKAAVSRREKSAARFRAISLAVEAETRLAYMRCMEGYKDLHTLELAVARARELAHAARAKAKVGEIEPVAADEAQANFLQDEVERLRMLGEVNARCAELSAALGTNYRSSAACE